MVWWGGTHWFSTTVPACTMGMVWIACNRVCLLNTHVYTRMPEHGGWSHFLHLCGFPFQHKLCRDAKLKSIQRWFKELNLKSTLQQSSAEHWEGEMHQWCSGLSLGDEELVGAHSTLGFLTEQNISPPWTSLLIKNVRLIHRCIQKKGFLSVPDVRVNHKYCSTATIPAMLYPSMQCASWPDVLNCLEGRKGLDFQGEALLSRYHGPIAMLCDSAHLGKIHHWLIRKSGRISPELQNFAVEIWVKGSSGVASGHAGYADAYEPGQIGGLPSWGEI